MTERFVHYARKPLEKVYCVKQGARAGVYKPCGLWFSVDDDALDRPNGWREWCEAEDFGLGHLGAQTEIIFKPKARLLRLRDALDIDLFTKEHVTKSRYPGDPYGEPDWPALARKYQGIIIAPYVWSRRLSDHTTWYYGWDCASGCVWDAKAVAELRVICRGADEAVAA